MTSTGQSNGMQNEIYATQDPFADSIAGDRSSYNSELTGGTSYPRASVDSQDDPHLPSIIFAIPFPVPKQEPSKRPVSPYLLYALPRTPYAKPQRDETGKDISKEGLVKKVERKWQEEIVEREKRQKGLEPNAGVWKTFKGNAVSVSDIRASGAGVYLILSPSTLVGRCGHPLAAQHAC
jgi:hypothetical protein